jgi:hypothetical protein
MNRISALAFARGVAGDYLVTLKVTRQMRSFTRRQPLRFL